MSYPRNDQSLQAAYKAQQMARFTKGDNAVQFQNAATFLLCMIAVMQFYKELHRDDRGR